ncbi:MAG: hypothetical protein ING89_10105 [Rubrivivax sp.]|jgi:hypothetical protein|nr:hypothetical protein [Rubrivivax sp.]
MKKTPAGLSHGLAPALPPHLVIALKPGWRLQADGVLVGARKRVFEPPLQVGARLEPAMPPLPAAPGRGPAGPAEAALQRFVHLRLPPGADVNQALQQVRAWDCVERADLAPQISLP